VAAWADALITVAGDRDSLARIVDAFRDGGGDGKPMFLQSVVVFAPPDDGWAIVRREWPQGGIGGDALWDIALPSTFEEQIRGVTAAQLAEREVARVSDSLDRHVEWLDGDRALGFNRVYLHDVARDGSFAETWGARLLASI
jgi:hypothetical protein